MESMIDIHVLFLMTNGKIEYYWPSLSQTLKKSSPMPLNRGNLYPTDSWHGTTESLFRASVKDSDAISCVSNSTNRMSAKKGIYRMRMVKGEERAKLLSSLKLNAFS